jgi:demethylmenaquinone methyltransferase/2-methoxy-6-polyprenyl-1,4-benzoquinol methylase
MTPWQFDHFFCSRRSTTPCYLATCYLQPAFDHFSLFAPFYDRVFDFLDPTRLRELLELPTAGRLLDAGGGTGRVAQALRGLAGQIVVTDLSAAMLRRAADKDGLYPVRAHAERLPFPDASFDRILVVDAFHHFCDQAEAAADLWRVLVPGGRPTTRTRTTCGSSSTNRHRCDALPDTT